MKTARREKKYWPAHRFQRRNPSDLTSGVGIPARVAWEKDGEVARRMGFFLVEQNINYKNRKMRFFVFFFPFQLASEPSLRFSFSFSL